MHRIYKANEYRRSLKVLLFTSFKPHCLWRVPTSSRLGGADVSLEFRASSRVVDHSAVRASSRTIVIKVTHVFDLICSLKECAHSSTPNTCRTCALVLPLIRIREDISRDRLMRKPSAPAISVAAASIVSGYGNRTNFVRDKFRVSYQNGRLSRVDTT